MRQHIWTALKKKSDLLAAAIFPVHETPWYEVKGSGGRQRSQALVLLVLFHCFIRDIFSETRKREKMKHQLDGGWSCHFQSRQRDCHESGTSGLGKMVQLRSLLTASFSWPFESSWCYTGHTEGDVLRGSTRSCMLRRGAGPACRLGPPKPRWWAYRCMAALVCQPFLLDWLRHRHNWHLSVRYYHKSKQMLPD